MNEIVEVSEGAFFIPCYSEQTIVKHDPDVAVQSGIVVVHDYGSHGETEEQYDRPPEMPSEIRDPNAQEPGSRL